MAVPFARRGEEGGDCKNERSERGKTVFLILKKGRNVNETNTGSAGAKVLVQGHC